MSACISRRWPALVLAALTEAGPLAPWQLVDRLRLSQDHIYMITMRMRKAGQIIITRRELSRESGISQCRRVMVFGLPGRDPVYVAKPRAKPGTPATQQNKRTAGSGRVAGPCYFRQMANWGRRI